MKVTIQVTVDEEIRELLGKWFFGGKAPASEDQVGYVLNTLIDNWKHNIKQQLN